LKKGTLSRHDFIVSIVLCTFLEYVRKIIINELSDSCGLVQTSGSVKMFIIGADCVSVFYNV